MHSEMIIGPFFIDGSMASEKYLTMLKTKFLPEAAKLGKINDCWFQQDGAPPHQTDEVLEYLNSVFGDRLVALDCKK